MKNFCGGEVNKAGPVPHVMSGARETCARETCVPEGLRAWGLAFDATRLKRR